MKVMFIDGKNACVLSEPIRILDQEIPKYFIWNGASVPMFLRSVLFVSPFHRTVRRASLYHDHAYTYQHNRKAADRAYYKLCRRDGANLLQSALMYAGLRMFGWVAYNKHRRTP